MAASSAISSSQQEQVEQGLRPVRLRQDLGPIADLIETAFGPTMDTAGRAAVKEMRALSHAGPLIWLIASMEKGVRSMSQGFVWIDPTTRQLVGNVSMYFSEIPRVVVIANVAVHPNFQRRGIAITLMEAAMQAAVDRNATELVLQVDADNDGARRLYDRLGFETQAAFTRWQWYPAYHAVIPPRRTNAPDITLASGRDWRAIQQLANAARPDDKGGLGWLRPNRNATFKRTWGEVLLSFIGLPGRQWWIMRGSDGQLLAAMSLQQGFGVRYRLAELLVHPSVQGTGEYDMLGFAMRHVSDMRRGLMIEHPSHDQAATAFFDEYHFEVRRRLVHMNWRPE